MSKETNGIKLLILDQMIIQIRNHPVFRKIANNLEEFRQVDVLQFN
jgi:hypothetical protein